MFWDPRPLFEQVVGEQVHLDASTAAAFSCDWAEWCKVCLVHSSLGLLPELHLSHGDQMICPPDPQPVGVDRLHRLRNDLHLDLDGRPPWSLATIGRPVVDGVGHEVLGGLVEDGMVLFADGGD